MMHQSVMVKEGDQHQLHLLKCYFAIDKQLLRNNFFQQAIYQIPL